MSWEKLDDGNTDEFTFDFVTEELIDTFLYAGEISLKLREKGLIKEIKSLALNIELN